MQQTSTLVLLGLSPVLSMTIIQRNTNILPNISSFEFFQNKKVTFFIVLVVIVAFLKLIVWCFNKAFILFGT